MLRGEQPKRLAEDSQRRLAVVRNNSDRKPGSDAAAVALLFPGRRGRGASAGAG